MKKYIVLLFAVIFLVPCVAGADSTDRCEMIEFVELFTQRITQYQDQKNVDFKMLPGAYSSPLVREGILIFESAAGSISVRTDDYTVHEVIITLANSNDNQSKYEERLICASAAISALEANASADYMAKAMGSSAMDMAQIIMYEIIGNQFQDSVNKALSENTRIKVYEGNYSYFIKCQTIDDLLIVYLVAREH